MPPIGTFPWSVQLRPRPRGSPRRTLRSDAPDVTDAVGGRTAHQPATFQVHARPRFPWARCIQRVRSTSHQRTGWRNGKFQ